MSVGEGTMVVFVSLVQDRHTDLEVAVFRDRDVAIEHTRRRFREVVRWTQGIREIPVEPPEVLFLRYEYESDYAKVYEVELQ